MHHLKIPTSPKLVQSLLRVMEGPQNIPGATPQLSFISAKKVLYGFQKKVAADREADTFDTHHYQTCPGRVLMRFGPLSKVLGHPQNVTPSWVWQLLHEHTWPVTWSEHWLGNGLVAHGGSPDLVTLPPSLYSRIVWKGAHTMGVGGSRAFPLHHVWICGPAPTLQA